MNGNIFQLVYAQLTFYTSLCRCKGDLADDSIAYQQEELKVNVCLQSLKKKKKNTSQQNLLKYIVKIDNYYMIFS